MAERVDDPQGVGAAALAGAAKPTRKATTYMVQHEVELYSRAENVDPAGEPSYSPMTAWLDLGPYSGTSQREAISAARKERSLKTGRFRALPESSAKVHAPRVEKREVEVWD